MKNAGQRTGGMYVIVTLTSCNTKGSMFGHLYSEEFK